MEDDAQTLIIDNGSGLIKAGLSGGEAPKCSFPNIAGKPRSGMQQVAPGAKEVYYGHEALQKRGVLVLAHPIKNGYVKNWDYLEELWKITINQEVGVEAKDHPMFVTDPIKSSKFQRAKLMALAFEKFQAPSFYVLNPGILSLYAGGKTTGLILDSGDGVTQIIPVMDEYTLPHASKRLNIGGKNILEGLTTLLGNQGLDHNSMKSNDILREIKETKCYVAQDYEQELKAFSDGTAEASTFELPDGTQVDLGSVQIECPEALFSPYMLGCEFEGIQHSVIECVKKCDMSIRKELYKNILLAGGSTMFKGFSARLKKEVSALTPASVEVNVLAPNERLYSSWIGASILTGLSSFSKFWISKQEYEEHGKKILDQKSQDM